MGWSQVGSLFGISFDTYALARLQGAAARVNRGVHSGIFSRSPQIPHNFMGGDTYDQ